MLMGPGLIQQASEVITKEADNCFDLFRCNGAVGAKIRKDGRLWRHLCRAIIRWLLPTACHA